MSLKTLYFTGPGSVDIRESEIPSPEANTVLVRTIASGISPGTELLIYRGQAPSDMVADATISSLSHALTFPFPYGYCAVGEVVETGVGVHASWIGKRVFAFHHHASYFVAAPDTLIEVPSDIGTEEAIFMPNMETAVNLLLDGRPLIGERAAVFGQGIVGLLTLSLLAMQPIFRLISFDPNPERRRASLAAGAHFSLDPLATDCREQANALLSDNGFDLVYELSGSPAALDQAVSMTGYDGRVIVGSWYGTKRASLDLGSHFHRSRMKLISSQVSTISPDLLGRWNNARRIDAAWEMIRRIRPAKYITHRYPIERAAEAYEALDNQADAIMQAVLTYDN
ncbi:zinc-binding alcohol dehydrogenase [Cohnella sp. GCM10027633]|uniref:zinc-dependent alcohol dehydrogenase n=1 Tax=unclassified Cohnella TaxID=2636738 RepID=UPI003624D618